MIFFDGKKFIIQDENKWITVHPNGRGTNQHGENIRGGHVLIDGATGIIKSGMGGKFTGQKITEIKNNTKKIEGNFLTKIVPTEQTAPVKEPEQESEARKLEKEKRYKKWEDLTPEEQAAWKQKKDAERAREELENEGVEVKIKRYSKMPDLSQDIITAYKSYYDKDMTHEQKKQLKKDIKQQLKVYAGQPGMPNNFETLKEYIQTKNHCERINAIMDKVPPNGYRVTSEDMPVWGQTEKAVRVGQGYDYGYSSSLRSNGKGGVWYPKSVCIFSDDGRHVLAIKEWATKQTQASRNFLEENPTGYRGFSSTWFLTKQDLAFNEGLL